MMILYLGSLYTPTPSKLSFENCLSKHSFPGTVVADAFHAVGGNQVTNTVTTSWVSGSVDSAKEWVGGAWQSTKDFFG